jgi:hypothetical protein
VGVGGTVFRGVVVRFFFGTRTRGVPRLEADGSTAVSLDKHDPCEDVNPIGTLDGAMYTLWLHKFSSQSCRKVSPHHLSEPY